MLAGSARLGESGLWIHRANAWSSGPSHSLAKTRTAAGTHLGEAVWMRLLTILWLLAVALAAGCSNATVAASSPTGKPDAAEPSPISSLDSGTSLFNLDALVPADKAPCVPVGCTTATGRYCGSIGDNCGGTLDCGTCPAGQVCSSDNVCVGGPNCMPSFTCEFTGGSYCGQISDGCMRPLTCSDTCPTAGWMCTNNICTGPPSVCTPRTCDPAGGGHYCGKIGDGCGHAVDCGAGCPQAGWVCSNNLCMGGPGCSKVTCNDSQGVQQYCGDIGDGCGGALTCPSVCPKTGWTCNASLCVGGSSCAKFSCNDSAGVQQYCGEIGDGCGGSLSCPTTCPKTGWTCNARVCVGGPSCQKLTCTSASGAQYCGTVGDGCGGSLSCGTCSQSGWVCGSNNACVGGPDCVRVTCDDAAGAQQYCGDIGDGCGGTVHCPATCAAGVTCGSSVAHVCGGGSTCTNLCPKVQDCSGDPAKTSISGTVYDPAGNLPLYNVIVYIPNAALDPIVTGPACDKCDAQASGHPLTTTLTDATGHFKLTKVPAGSNIPLVMQVGKWRRQVTIPTVNPCVDNPISDSNLLRLPAKQSEGNLPQIAMVVGFSDGLDCLLRRVGIADSEFTAPGGTGRVHLYTTPKAATAFDPTLNGGAAYGDAATALWASAAQMKKYDMMVMSCEGTPNKDLKTAAMHQAVKSYADIGGKIFGSHWHDVWVYEGPMPWPTVIDFPGLTNTTGTGTVDNLSSPPDGTVVNINTTFPKGKALADWLNANGGSPGSGTLAVTGAEHSMNASTALSTTWISGKDTTNSSYPSWLAYTSFGTPVEQAPNYCGRVVMTDLHVFTGSGKKPFPSGCDLTKTLSGQEKALIFLFFDLSSCVTIDTATPVAPPPAVGGAAQPAAPAPPPPPPPPPDGCFSTVKSLLGGR